MLKIFKKYIWVIWQVKLLVILNYGISFQNLVKGKEGQKEGREGGIKGGKEEEREGGKKEEE